MPGLTHTHTHTHGISNCELTSLHKYSEKQMMIAKDSSYCKMKKEKMTIIYNNAFQFNSFFSILFPFSSAVTCTSTAGDSVMRNMIILKRINFMSCGFCKITYYYEQIKSLLLPIIILHSQWFCSGFELTLYVPTIHL